jgi:hypothetical protein
MELKWSSVTVGFFSAPQGLNPCFAVFLKHGQIAEPKNSWTWGLPGLMISSNQTAAEKGEQYHGLIRIVVWKFWNPRSGQ